MYSYFQFEWIWVEIEIYETFWQVEEKFDELRTFMMDKPYTRHLITPFVAIENDMEEGEDPQVKLIVLYTVVISKVPPKCLQYSYGNKFTAGKFTSRRIWNWIFISKMALKRSYNQQNVANEACLHVSGTFAI